MKVEVGVEVEVSASAKKPEVAVRSAAAAVGGAEAELLLANHSLTLTSLRERRRAASQPSYLRDPSPTPSLFVPCAAALTIGKSARSATFATSMATTSAIVPRTSTMGTPCAVAAAARVT